MEVRQLGTSKPVIYFKARIYCYYFFAVKTNMAGVETEIETEHGEIEDIQSTELDKTDKLIKLPLARIRTIIKQDPDVHLASHDSVVLIAKATVSYICTSMLETEEFALTLTTDFWFEFNYPCF